MDQRVHPLHSDPGRVARAEREAPRLVLRARWPRPRARRCRRAPPARSSARAGSAGRRRSSRSCAPTKRALLDHAPPPGPARSARPRPSRSATSSGRKSACTRRLVTPVVSLAWSAGRWTVPTRTAAAIDLSDDKVSGAQKGRDELGLRAQVELGGRSDLQQPPEVQTASRSPSSNASSWSWVTKIGGDLQLALDAPQGLAQLAADAWRRARRTARRAAEPRAGGRAPARAPPAAAGRPRAGCGRRPPRPESPTSSSSSSRRRAPLPACDAAHAQRELDVLAPPSCGGTARSAGRRSRLRAPRAAGAVTSRPWSSTRPASASASPAIIRSTVLLPLPLGPRRTKSSPVAIERERSLTTERSPYRFVTCSSSIDTAVTAPDDIPE